MIMMSSIIYIYIHVYVYVYIYEHRSDDGIRGKFLSGFHTFQWHPFENANWKRGKITEPTGGSKIQSELKRNPQVLGNDFSTPKVKKVICEKHSSSISVSASFKIVSR